MAMKVRRTLILKKSFISPCSRQHEIVLHIRKVIHISKQTQRGGGFHSTFLVQARPLPKQFLLIWKFDSQESTVNLLLRDDVLIC